MHYPRSVYRLRERLVDRSATRSWPASFADRLTHPVPSGRKVNQLVRSGGMRAKDLSAAADIPVHPGGWVRADPGDIAVTWVGHASCVIQIGGLVVLTDPVWSNRIPGVRARLTAPGLALADLPTIDAVLISHNHFDHLDARTIRQLDRATPVLVPAGLGWWFRRYHFTTVVELDWWETTTIIDVEFQFVPAHHWSKRTPFDTCRSLWGGFMLTTPAPTGGADAGAARRVYFAGDTAYGRYFRQIAERHPGIDLAIMPVGAFEPRWFMKPLHMNPPEAVRACGDVGARRMMTMHWGTFVLSSEPLLAPLEGARQAWAQTDRPRADLWDLAVGETRTIAGAAADEPAAGPAARTPAARTPAARTPADRPLDAQAEV